MSGRRSVVGKDLEIDVGQFWKVTTMAAWYLTRIMRLEFIFAYVVPHRFNLEPLQFFESRIQ